MKTVVASGKGGTGKTTVALALSEVLGNCCTLADCDVEEPNCHLFCRETVIAEHPVMLPVPEFAYDVCSGCGRCVAACRFNALAKLRNRILVFNELCHNCGNCIRQCPEQALATRQFNAGRIKVSDTGKFTLVTGVMNVGYSMAPPVIRQLKKFTESFDQVIFDAPPGTACPMVTVVRGCDFVVLVTEPTPFGLHDLSLAYQVAAGLGKKCGVILNRAGSNDQLIEKFCADNGVPLLLKIPFDRSVAEAYSQGRTLLEALPRLRQEFKDVLNRIQEA